MKVVIRPECHAEIDYYVQNSPNKDEISGFGRIKAHGDGTMEVVKIYFLPEQLNSGGSTEINDEAIADLLYDTRNDEGDLNFWWHSHVDMGVFWSSTDHECIRQIGDKGYCLATVFNRKGEMKSAYYQGGNGFLPPVFVDNIETKIGTLPREEDTKLWKANIERMKAWEKKNRPKPPKVKQSWSGMHYPRRHGETIWNNDAFVGPTTLGSDASNPFYTSSGIPKRDRRGRKKRYDPEDIPELSKDSPKEDYIALVNTYMTKPEQEIWYECLLEVTPPADIEKLTVIDLWNWYELFDGDMDEMQKHVLMEMSAEVQSNDPAILGI